MDAGGLVTKTRLFLSEATYHLSPWYARWWLRFRKRFFARDPNQLADWSVPVERPLMEVRDTGEVTSPERVSPDSKVPGDQK